MNTNHQLQITFKFVNKSLFKFYKVSYGIYKRNS